MTRGLWNRNLTVVRKGHLDTFKTHLTMLALFCHSVALLRSLAVHLGVWLESGCHGHLVVNGSMSLQSNS